MRFVGSCGLALSLLSIVSACDGGEHSTLEIELAASPAPGGSGGDEQCTPAARAALPADVDCVSITACREDGGRCEPVRVLRPGDDRATQTFELRLPREGGNNDVEIDLELASGAEHRVEMIVYTDGAPYARARAEGVVAGQGTIRLRLEPYARWACASPRADGSAPAARALHVAVAVPNGDVLLIGGVTGTSVPASAVDGGALLQRSVEVYDASDARFRAIDVRDHDGSEGIGAVFHAARYLETLADGRYRVRVYGGFTAADQPAARFDALQGLTNYSSPLLPAARAERRDSIDLLYDPRRHAIEVALVDPGAVQRAGLNAVSEPDAEGRVIVALGLLDGGGTALRPSPMLSGQWYSLPLAVTPGVASMPMLAPRFGHTASRLSASTVLVWGGDVTQPTPEAVIAQGGELITATSGAIAATAMGLPPPTSFHSATPIEGGVLIAGGMVIEPVAGMSGGISTTVSTQPLTVVTSDPTNGVAGTPIDAGDWPTSIVHGATALPDGSVLLSGGAIRAMPAGTPSPSHLWASDATLAVSRDAGGGYTTRTLARLVGARWGHQLTPLPGGRVLVTGGFVRDGGTLRAISAAETLLLDEPPPSIASCTATSGDAAAPPPSDAGTVEEDAASVDVDAAPAEEDAGL